MGKVMTELRDQRKKGECSVQFPIYYRALPISVSVVNLIRQLENENSLAKIHEIKWNKDDLRIKVVLSDEKTNENTPEPKIIQSEDKIEVLLADDMNVKGIMKAFGVIDAFLSKSIIKNASGTVEQFQINDGKIKVVLSPSIQVETGKKTNTVPFHGETLLLIDGSNMLTRAYFATVASGNVMKTSDGAYTNAVYSMVQSLFNLLKKHKPRKVCILWDISRDTWRRDLYSDYKAQRSETDPELKEQFHTAQALFEKMHIPQMASNEYEADDLIGTLAAKFTTDFPEGQVLMISSDKDLLQLLNDRTRQIMIHRGKETVYTEEAFRQQYGISPAQWADVKAILGDKSDNIPGVKGCGEKAAYPLVQEFGSLEQIYKNLDQLGTNYKRYLKKLEEGKDIALLSKKLATIVTNIDDLIKDWDSLNIKMSKKGTIEGFKTLEFDTLLEKIG